MKNERKFFRCAKCGNLAVLVENAGHRMICCGEPMTELMPNTVDAAREKHMPVLSRESWKLKAAVGVVRHPMTEEHHISWIAAVEETRTTLVRLPVNGIPEAEFRLDGGSVTVYAYCNLHGLWAVDL
ncbi:MAG: desulfoferrodoxin [Treponema sp.]|nr:desulfoferrodoxin [Treponema sp.]